MNKNHQQALVVSLIGLMLFFAGPRIIFARSSVADLEARVEDLENNIGGNLNIDIANKIDALEQEVQDLRGMVEELQNLSQNHTANSVNPAKQQATPINLGQNSGQLEQYSGSSDQIAYDDAYRLIESNDFSEAIVAFKDFLWQHKDSKYAPSATYWLGELYLTEDKLELASEYFLKVVQQYPEHAQAPDALFKLGMLEMGRDNWQVAKDYFNKIKKHYADSSRVYMANAKLKILEREGH